MSTHQFSSLIPAALPMIQIGGPQSALLSQNWNRTVHGRLVGHHSLAKNQLRPTTLSELWETFALHVVLTTTTRAKVSHLSQYDSCCTAVRVLTHPHWAPAIEHRRTRPVAYGEALLAIQRRMLSISFTASSACSVSPVEGTRRPS